MANDAFAGRWLGGFAVADGWRFLQLDLRADPRESSAFVLFEDGIELEDCRVAGRTLSLLLRRGDERWQLTGERDADVIKGSITSSDGTRPAHLLRTRPLDDTHPVRGTCGSADGRRISIFMLDGLPLPGSLGMLDLPSGEVRGLFPTSSGTLTTGASLLVPEPREREFSFEQLVDGKFQRLSAQVAGRDEEFSRLQLREEEFRFESAGVTLAGTLVLPRGDGPHPAVVIAHGSGPVGRDDPFSHVLAERGFAFLRYDKRGVGASGGGDWHSASFDDLADDLIAALRALAARADIDRTRMGLWGWSQGGWVGPLAASRAPDFVSFLVVQVAPAVSPAEQELDRVEHEMRTDHYPEADVAAALEFMRQKFEYARARASWPAFAQLLERAQQSTWFSIAGSPTEPDDWGWDFFQHINDYDPIPVLERVRCPTLALYGERDRNVIPAVNAHLLEAALARAGAPLTLRVFEGANHGLLESRTGSTKELPLMHRYVPGYVSTLFDWLDATVRPMKTNRSG